MKTKWCCNECKKEYETIDPNLSRCPQCGKLNSQGGTWTWFASPDFKPQLGNFKEAGKTITTEVVSYE